MRKDFVFSSIIATIRTQLTNHAQPQAIARSFALGMYIAFSPFPGAHALMMLAAKFFLPIHFPTLFFATSLNNPWTMVPFYSLDYAFGFWLVHHLFGWDPELSVSFTPLLGCGKLCVWSFLIGGNLLGLAAAALSYILIYRFSKTVTASLPQADHGTCNQQKRLP